MRVPCLSNFLRELNAAESSNPKRKGRIKAGVLVNVAFNDGTYLESEFLVAQSKALYTFYARSMSIVFPDVWD